MSISALDFLVRKIRFKKVRPKQVPRLVIATVPDLCEHIACGYPVVVRSLEGQEVLLETPIQQQLTEAERTSVQHADHNALPHLTLGVRQYKRVACGKSVRAMTTDRRSVELRLATADEYRHQRIASVAILREMGVHVMDVSSSYACAMVTPYPAHSCQAHCLPGNSCGF